MIIDDDDDDDDEKKMFNTKPYSTYVYVPLDSNCTSVNESRSMHIRAGKILGFLEKVFRF